MFDRDLAALCEVPTRVLNQAVRRNIARFPEDFAFALTKTELENWRSQIVTSNLPPEWACEGHPTFSRKRGWQCYRRFCAVTAPLR
jgi:hypothetical protein